MSNRQRSTTEKLERRVTRMLREKPRLARLPGNRPNETPTQRAMVKASRRANR